MFGKTWKSSLAIDIGGGRFLYVERYSPMHVVTEQDLNSQVRTVAEQVLANLDGKESSTLAPALHARHLDVRRRPSRPSRYRHTTPPQPAHPSRLDSLSEKPKRLDSMSNDSIG
jgi:hypothetical protein